MLCLSCVNYKYDIEMDINHRKIVAAFFFFSSSGVVQYLCSLVVNMSSISTHDVLCCNLCSSIICAIIEWDVVSWMGWLLNEQNGKYYILVEKRRFLYDPGACDLNVSPLSFPGKLKINAGSS